MRKRIARTAARKRVASRHRPSALAPPRPVRESARPSPFAMYARCSTRYLRSSLDLRTAGELRTRRSRSSPDDALRHEDPQRIARTCRAQVAGGGRCTGRMAATPDLGGLVHNPARTRPRSRSSSPGWAVRLARRLPSMRTALIPRGARTGDAGSATANSAGRLRRSCTRRATEPCSARPSARLFTPGVRWSTIRFDG